MAQYLLENLVENALSATKDPVKHHLKAVKLKKRVSFNTPQDVFLELYKFRCYTEQAKAKVSLAVSFFSQKVLQF